MNEAPEAPTAPTGFIPVLGSERIESIDVLRGFALLGIIVVNSLLFALPCALGLIPPFTGVDGEPGSTSDWIAWWIVSVFFSFKFISIFSILFGVGAAIQFDRARAAGRSFDTFFLRRLGVLLIFGLIHAVFFWYGDILTIYALVGVWLLFLCRFSQRTLVIIGILLLLIPMFFYGLAALAIAFSPPNPALGAPVTDLPPNALGCMNAANFNFETPVWQAGEIRAYAEGPYSDLFLYRIVTWGFSLIVTLFFFSWHVLSMFAFGIAMVRSGFFGEGGGKLRCYAVAIALPIGLIIELVRAGITMSMGEEMPWIPELLAGVGELSVPLVAIGYAGLLTWFVRSGALSFVFRMMACAGRMALTVYLLETVIMTTLFYHYGFGLFGEVDRIWLLPISLGVWTLLAVFSTIWLSVFASGPFEWLWRSLSYMKLLGRG